MLQNYAKISKSRLLKNYDDVSNNSWFEAEKIYVFIMCSKLFYKTPKKGVQRGQLNQRGGQPVSIRQPR